MGQVVALQYQSEERDSAERQRRRALRMAWIEERIAAITDEIYRWNKLQLKTADLIRIAEAVSAIMFDDAPDIMTLSEAARRLGIHYKTARALVGRGDLPAFRVGGSWRVAKAALIDWIAAQQRPQKREKKDGSL